MSCTRPDEITAGEAFVAKALKSIGTDTFDWKLMLGNQVVISIDLHQPAKFQDRYLLIGKTNGRFGD